MSDKPLVIITGPTAAGKTDLSIALAKRINGAIISADSMQVYKYMNIGSAKISQEEMCGIDHYLIDCLEPSDTFNVVVFKELALKALQKIYSDGKLPIVVGGTGFYIQALLRDVDFSNGDEDKAYRQELAEYAGLNGNEALHDILRKIDPESAAVIHANNVKRVIRALEFYKTTGQTISEHNKTEKEKKSAYNSAYFVLNMPRNDLYDRIDKRVDTMIEKGLVDEVKTLMEHGCTRDMVSMQGLGYKEIIDYLNGQCSLEEAVYTIKRDTRHFAKRQLTWFSREEDVCFINKQDYSNEGEILQIMLDLLTKKGII